MNSQSDNTHQPLDEAELRKAVFQYLTGLEDAEIVTEDILRLFQSQLAAAEKQARITAITDVDNLNLLNDSDEWHDWYLHQIQFKADTNQSHERGE